MKKSLKAYLYIMPAALAFLIFVIGPFLYTFYLSFFDWNMISPDMKFVGIDNYVRVLTDPVFYKVLKNTLAYIFILLLTTFLFPYILSYLLSLVIKKFKGFYRSAFFLPSVISMVIGSVLFTWILNPLSGPVAIILSKFGFGLPNWTRSEGWIILVISLITTWKAFGYNFIVLLGGIYGVDESVVEAARLEGAGNFRIFVDIVVPMSSATGVFVLITSIVQGLQYVFTPIKVISQGGPNYASANLIYQSYHEAFTLYRTGTSSAMSMITMIIFVILLIIEFKIVERGVYYEN